MPSTGKNIPLVWSKVLPSEEGWYFILHGDCDEDCGYWDGTFLWVDGVPNELSRFILDNAEYAGPISSPRAPDDDRLDGASVVRETSPE